MFTDTEHQSMAQTQSGRRKVHGTSSSTARGPGRSQKSCQIFGAFAHLEGEGSESPATGPRVTALLYEGFKSSLHHDAQLYAPGGGPHYWRREITFPLRNTLPSPWLTLYQLSSQKFSFSLSQLRFLSQISFTPPSCLHSAPLKMIKMHL